jgi:hypothetical protein
LVMASWPANNKVAMTSKKIPFVDCSALVKSEVLLLF